ncbi:hypothetical protein CJU90_3296 [Yarrowia sp. C11]|nr:hypothetical protein CKK34_4743 [Yarrowia sp. E02]KAG5369769.1 hypothetical protein CJU90_3296 [Yarrowia sp. C11]
MKLSFVALTVLASVATAAYERGYNYIPQINWDTDMNTVLKPTGSAEQKIYKSLHNVTEFRLIALSKEDGDNGVFKSGGFAKWTFYKNVSDYGNGINLQQQYAAEHYLPDWKTAINLNGTDAEKDQVFRWLLMNPLDGKKAPGFTNDQYRKALNDAMDMYIAQVKAVQEEAANPGSIIRAYIPLSAPPSADTIALNKAILSGGATASAHVQHIIQQAMDAQTKLINDLQKQLDENKNAASADVAKLQTSLEAQTNSTKQLNTSLADLSAATTKANTDNTNNLTKLNTQIMDMAEQQQIAAADAATAAKKAADDATASDAKLAETFGNISSSLEAQAETIRQLAAQVTALQNAPAPVVSPVASPSPSPSPSPAQDDPVDPKNVITPSGDVTPVDDNTPVDDTTPVDPSSSAADETPVETSSAAADASSSAAASSGAAPASATANGSAAPVESSAAASAAAPSSNGGSSSSSSNSNSTSESHSDSSANANVNIYIVNGNAVQGSVDPAGRATFANGTLINAPYSNGTNSDGSYVTVYVTDCPVTTTDAAGHTVVSNSKSTVTSTVCPKCTKEAAAAAGTTQPKVTPAPKAAPKEGKEAGDIVTVFVTDCPVTDVDSEGSTTVKTIRTTITSTICTKCDKAAPTMAHSAVGNPPQQQPKSLPKQANGASKAAFGLAALALPMAAILL